MISRSSARMRTNNASRYVVQFGQDWAKVPSLLICDRTHAAIALPFGRCLLTATPEFLDVSLVSGSAVETAALEDFMSCHLDRLSRGERLVHEWISPPVEPQDGLARPFMSRAA